jgi:hypothetical protein
MLRVLFLTPVLLFTGVSATFNVIFSLTLSEHWVAQWCWIAFGLGCALYSGMALDIVRQNFNRGSWIKGLVAFLCLLPALAWDARCAYGYASLEQDRARQHVNDEARKYAAAEDRVKAARMALAPYADAPDPIAADTTVDVLAKRTNDQRCAARTLSEEIRELCDQLSKARLEAARAHAKARLSAALETAEAALINAKAPPPKDSLAELIGPEWAKWLPTIALQLGSLLGIFATSLPAKPSVEGKPAKPSQLKSEPAPLRRPPSDAIAIAQQSRLGAEPGPGSIVESISMLIRYPEQCPAGLGVDDGWLQGPQRLLASKLGIPVSKLNAQLKVAFSSGALRKDTSSGVTRLKPVRH